VALGSCNITAKLLSEGPCLWPPEHRSPFGLRLINPGVDEVFLQQLCCWFKYIYQINCFL